MSAAELQRMLAILATRSNLTLSQPGVVAIPFYNGSVEEGKKRFKAFYEVGPIVDMAKEIPYSQMNSLMVPSSLSFSSVSINLNLWFRTRWWSMAAGSG